MNVEKLKQKILDLAIRGKLVPQDPNDEPASVLVEKIRAEKEALIEQGKIKRDKNESYIFKGDDNSYYEKINDTTHKINFNEPLNTTRCIWLKGNQLFLPMETAKVLPSPTFEYIDIDAIDNIQGKVKKPKVIQTINAPSRAKRKIFDGSTLFSMVRPYLRNIAYINKDNASCIASTGFYVCTPQPFVLPKYLYYLMSSSYVVNGINFFMKGDNSPSVRADQIESFLFPVPSVSYQKKAIIVLEKLFAKISEISKSTNEIYSLTEQLRYKILDFFFGNNSRYKSYYEYEENCLSNIATLITKGSTPTTYGFEYLSEGINFIKVENVKDYCVQHNTIKQFISEAAHEFQKRSQLEKDDLLISIAGTLGRICLIKNEDLPANTNQAFAIVRGYTQTLLADYLKWFVTWYVDSKSQQLGHGGGMDNLTLGEIKALKIKYPVSKDEQQHIIDKVNACLEIVSAIESVK